MQPATPAAPAVRETLEKVLASETFSRSERARDLLRYLVEREQAGEAERLKGFSIAVDVFGKDAGFDPANDPVVRVQAGRLRELLAQYAAGEGASEPVRIAIPRGSYVPSYEWAAPCDKASPEPLPDLAPAVSAVAATARVVRSTGTVRPGQGSPAPFDLGRQVRLVWVALAAIIAMLGFLVLRMSLPGTPPSATTVTASTANATVAVPASATGLPSVAVESPGSDESVARVAGVFRRALPGFDTIDFISSQQAASASSTDPLAFTFDIAPGQETGGVDIGLQNRATGKVLASWTLDTKNVDAHRLDDKVADILSSTIPVSGILYSFVEQAGLQRGLGKCLLLNDDYYLDQKSGTHLPAYRCFEEMMQEGSKSPLVYSELAALHLETVTDKYDYPANANEEQALKLAHQAVQMGATSPYAHRAYGFLLSRTGKAEESIRFMRKAYELNTFDLSMAAAYAYALVFAGDYDLATPIMRRAVEASSSHPSWWDYALFLGSFMTEDHNSAARAAETLATTKRPHYLGARLIVAAAARDEAQRIALIEQIVKEYPKFAADPRATFVKANYPADLTDRLVASLRSAGLGGPS